VRPGKGSKCESITPEKGKRKKRRSAGEIGLGKRPRASNKDLGSPPSETKKEKRRTFVSDKGAGTPHHKSVETGNRTCVTLTWVEKGK